MDYSIIQPPFTLKFREMPKPELKAYAAWFHDSFAERQAELAGAVQRTPGFEAWTPDLSAGSVEALGNWFVDQVEVRSRTSEELGALAEWVSASKHELTNRTFSLAYDIGMYFGRAVIEVRRGARWDQPLGNKKFADYGQPVIEGLGVVPLNPVRIAVTLAYGIAARTKGRGRLRELYDYWIKQGLK